MALLPGSAEHKPAFHLVEEAYDLNKGVINEFP